MRAALQSPTLGSYARQFVWLDLDYDEPRNGPFVADHVAGTAMLLVMEPASGLVLDVWTGSATPEQLAAIFTHALALPGDPADVALRRGDALIGRNDFVNAVTAYEQALAAGGSAANTGRAPEQQLTQARQPASMTRKPSSAQGILP